VRLLIDAGASLDAVDATGETTLYDAACEGHARVCSLLLARGASAKVRNAIGLTALYVSAEKGLVAAIEALVHGGAEIDDGGTNITPLAMAVQRQHLEPEPRSSEEAVAV